MNMFFDSNQYHSIFSKNAIAKPELAKVWLGTWRDIDGEIHHDLLHSAETSNQAEFLSMIQILRHLRSMVEAKHINDWLKEVFIYGDSQIVIYQMSGKYKVREPDLRVLYLEAVHLVLMLKEEFGIIIRFRWIERGINNEALHLKKKITQIGPAE